MMLARLAGTLVAVVSLAWAAAAGAGPLDDAKNLLSRLNDVGDYGRSSAEGSVRQAREATERNARDQYDAAVRSLADLRPKLEDLERRYANASKDGATSKYEQRRVATGDRDTKLANKQLELDQARKQVGDLERKAASSGKLTPEERTRLEASRSKLGALQKELAAVKDKDATLDQRDKAKLDTMMKEARERYESAMAAANAQLVTGIASGLTSLAGGAVNGTVGDIQHRVDDARSRLRGLVPQPIGTRSATRIERQCATIAGREVCNDVRVPNEPSDGDLGPAVNAARAALDDVGRAGQLALAKFEDSQARSVDLQNTLTRYQQFLQAVSNAVKKYDETAKAIVANLKG